MEKASNSGLKNFRNKDILHLVNDKDLSWLEGIKDGSIRDVYFDCTNIPIKEALDRAEAVKIKIRSLRSIFEPVVVGPIQDEDRDIVEQEAQKLLRTTSLDFVAYAEEMFQDDDEELPKLKLPPKPIFKKYRPKRIQAQEE